jgi:CRP/FNR family transcriptional regulator, cyclic AMP receptor protein
MAILSAQLMSLSTFPLFRGLSSDELARLTKSFHPIIIPSRTNIITAGQPGSAAYLILAGTLKVHVEQADGSNVILGIHGVGELVGEMSLLDRRECCATVVTLEPSTLCWIDHGTFETCLQTMPVLSYNLSRHLSQRLRLAAAHIQAFATLDIYGRVARQLLAFAQEYGEVASSGAVLIPLRLTQGDLADIVGASRMRVNRVLCFYKEQHYLSMHTDGRITIHRPESLAQRCHSDIQINSATKDACKV